MTEQSPAKSLSGTLTPVANGVRPARWWRWFLLVAITLVTLWAGLDPKDYRFRNEVDWLEDRPGLRFASYGRVHTVPYLDQSRAQELNRGGFSLELALTPSKRNRGYFQVIAAFHAGDDASQLVICQWREHIVVMNGDDYNHRRRLPRVTADTSLFARGPLILTVNSGTNGTALFINGESVATNHRLRLTLPAAPQMARLVLGNSVNANLPWTGELLGFAFYPRPLASGEIKRHHAAWSGVGTFSFAQRAQPSMLFTFEEPGDHLIQNQGSLKVPLEIPPRAEALGRRALIWSVPSGVPEGVLAMDTVVNFLGFIPFGFALALALPRDRQRRLRTIGLVFVTGFFVSLLIELAQAWIPSRDSSLRDLLLNTIGTPFGAVGALCIERLLTGHFRLSSRYSGS